MSIANFSYAGRVYEQMGAFDRAGDAFEKAEDIDRAAYCYERAGFAEKAAILQARARNGGPRSGQGNRPTRNSPFALGAVSAPQLPYLPEEGHNDENESTQIVPVPGRENQETPRVDVMPPPVPTLAPGVPPRHLPQAPVGFSLKAVEMSEPPAVEKLYDSPLSIQDAPSSEAAEEALIRMDEGRAAFHKGSFFTDLDFEQRNRLWGIGSVAHYGPRETILDFDDEPAGLYTIALGTVHCFKMVNGKEQYVDQMLESEHFGELWLLVDTPTAVKFVAAAETKIHIIEREIFNGLLDKDGTIARKLYKAFTKKLLRRLLKPQNQNEIKIAG